MQKATFDFRSLRPWVALLLPGLVLTFPFSSRALTNYLALTPPMGWTTWNAGTPSEALTRAAVNAMATNGMQAAGFQYVNLDGGWDSGSRSTNGVMQADPVNFPNGLKVLADYVHSKGFKFGFYVEHGNSPDFGTYLHEYEDANTLAAWGFDLLKSDNFTHPDNNDQGDYTRMSAALMACGRPIDFSLCYWQVWSWEPVIANMWRVSGDNTAGFGGMESELAHATPMAFLAGPGRWNDPDIVEADAAGNPQYSLTHAQAQTEYSLWCMVAAPLLVGLNFPNVSAQTVSIYTNKEINAVDQDPAGEQGVPLGNVTTWVKPLGYNFTTKAVALYNPNGTTTSMTVNWGSIGLRPGNATVRDLWAQTDLGTFNNSFTTNVQPFSTVVLRVVGTAPLLPVLGTNYVTDLQPAYGYIAAIGNAVYSDPPRTNVSYGSNTLTLNGKTYAKGLGVSTYSGVEYRLGGIASRFRSDIGVDDEVGSGGSVVFHVLADGNEIYSSGVMRGGATHQSINLDVTGVNRLTLGVSDADDGSGSDHADWAGALVVVSNTVPVPPLAPTGLSANPGIPISLTWNANRSALSYNLKRALASAGPYTNIASSAVPACVDTNATSDITYYYVVSAVSTFGESSDSAPASVLACTPPAAPTGVTAVVNVGGTTNIIIRWNPVPGATSYNVDRAYPWTPYSAIASGLTSTNYTDSNVGPGTNYSYVVVANNSCSQSGQSAFALATPPPLPAPVVNNGAGETNLSVGVAQLRGTLTNGPADVSLYWDTTDGGTNGNWANVIFLSSMTNGAFSANVNNLLYGFIYYYRCYAVNQWGSAWAPATTSFTTLPPATPASLTNSAATGISALGATLNAKLTCPGAVEDVVVYWGTTSGGTNAAAWGNSAKLGSWNDVTAANLSYSAAGLAPGTKYYYTFLATNALATLWATNAQSFTTPAFATLSYLTNLTSSLNTLLSPAFASSTYSYSVVPQPYTTTSLTVTPTAADPNASIKVNGSSVTSGHASGSIALGVGANVITIVVVSEDQSATNTYTLAVTRAPLVSLAIYEPFSGATGDLNGKAAGTGLTGTWNSSGNNVTAGSLTYGSLPTSGNHALTAGSGYSTAGANLSTALYNAGLLADGATLWYSALIRSVSVGRSYLAIGNGIADGFDRIGTSGLGMKLDSGQILAHGYDENYGGASRGNGVTVSDGVYLVVGKITWGANGSLRHTNSIYLPGTDLAWPGTPASTAVMTATVSQTNYNWVSLAGMSSTAIPEVDEIRFGASYAAVTGTAGVSGPGITNSPATGITTNTAVLNATLGCAGTNAAVLAYWNTVNGGTNAALWTNSAYVGAWTNVTSTNISYMATGLTSNTTYYFTFRATNLPSSIWAANVLSFTTLGPPLVDNSAGATNLVPGVAQLRGTLANAAADVRIYWGTTDGGTNQATWATMNLLTGVASGGFSGNVSNLLYGLPYYYRCSASNQWGVAWAPSTASFTTLRPQPIGLPVKSGLGLWLDASQLTGLTNAQQVNTWTDLSGHANHAVRQSGSSSGYPQYVTSQINGLPVVRFTSTDYFGFSRLSTIRSVFWVLKEPNDGFYFLLGDDTTYHFHRGASAPYTIWDGVNGWTSPNITSGTTRLMGTVTNGGSTVLPANQPIVLSVVTTGNVQANQLTLDRTFTNRSWYGDIAEILIYTNALSTGDEALVGGYLAAKYGLSTAYPAYSSGSSSLALSNNPAMAVGSASAALHATLACAGAVYQVTAFWNTVNGGTNATLWTNSAYVGSWTNLASTNLSFTATGLAPTTPYYFTFRATNALDVLWAANVQSFTTLAAALLPPLLPVSGVTLSNGVPSFTFTAAKGCRYRLEYKNLLTDANWSFGTWSTNTSGGDVQMTLTDTGAIGWSQRFYRLEAAYP